MINLDPKYVKYRTKRKKAEVVVQLMLDDLKNVIDDDLPKKVHQYATLDICFDLSYYQSAETAAITEEAKTYSSGLDRPLTREEMTGFMLRSLESLAVDIKNWVEKP